MSVFQSVNPATGKTMQRWPAWQDTEILEHVDEQARLWPLLRDAELEQRLGWLSAARELLERDLANLALTVTREMGKPITQAKAELNKTLDLIDFLRDHAQIALEPETLASGVEQAVAPLGGILGIMPWNYPIWQVCRFALPALVGGNTVTVKPAPNVLESTLELERLLAEAGFPTGAFRVIQADIDQLPLLYDHDHIRQVHFTGSSKAGREIAAACGQRLKPTTMELGGNDAWLLTESGDLDAFVRAALASRLNNSGQSCLCAKRWLVPASRLEDVLVRLREELAGYQPMQPENPESKLGPVARDDIRDRVLTQWQQLKVGASRHSPDPKVQGLFITPAWAVTADPMTSPVWPEEIFGPIIQLAAYSDQDQAISWANHSPYGLGGSVWAAEVDEARALALRLRTRNIGINRPMRSRIDIAFGGSGDSGWGQELGIEGLRSLMRTQVQFLE